MTRDLLPCPFCGGEPEIDTRRGYRSLEGKLGNAVAVYCTQCPADMDMCLKDTPDLSAEQILSVLTDAWNTRAKGGER